MKYVLSLILVMLLMVSCAPVGGQETEAQALTIDTPWARPALSGGNSAVYFTIENPGQEADRLLGAQCDAAQMVQVHMTVMEADGTSKMMHQEAVDIPAGESISFEPGGLHIMLMNLTEDLQPGQVLPVTLEFENAGAVEVMASVREP